jgi:membrane protein DedA with SNARE-associated domain
MSRRSAFRLVVVLVVLIMVPIVSAVVFSLLDEDGIFGIVGTLDEEVVSYFTVFGLVFADAIVPIFPGETTLTTASVAAADGTLDLALVIVAGALGAILGDSALYWIARTGPKRLKSRLEAASTKDERVESGLDLLGRSGPLLIACGRFVPGVRFAVNVMMGMTEYPYRRFLLFSAIGGSAWATYTCVLAYFVSTALADFALASIVISGLITSVLVGGVYWIDRHRRAGDAPSTTARHDSSRP